MDQQNLTELAQKLEEAGSFVKLLADSPSTGQGNLILKALNDINSRLGNLEKSMTDVKAKTSVLVASAAQ